ncbi:AAA family ATPase [Chloroflexota bacterium]
MEHFTPSEAPIHETQRLPIVPPGQIIGRNQALGQIFAQMRAGAALLLYGPPGVGKSALAATIASAFTTFPGGVLWWSVENDSLAQLIVRLGRAYNERTITESADPLVHLDMARQLLAR